MDAAGVRFLILATPRRCVRRAADGVGQRQTASLASGALSGDEAWNAAHVDEQWNISQWGEDSDAQRRFAARHVEFTAAAKMLSLLR